MCRTQGRDAKVWPHFPPCREPEELKGSPTLPGCAAGFSSRSPRPRTAAVRARAALTGATYTLRDRPPTPPPRRRRNPAQPDEDARAASTLAAPRETSRLLGLLRLRPAAEGASPTYARRRRRSFSGTRRSAGPRRPLGCGRQSRQLLRRGQEPEPRRKRRARARAAAAPGSGAGPGRGPSAR